MWPVNRGGAIIIIHLRKKFAAREKVPSTKQAGHEHRQSLEQNRPARVTSVHQVATCPVANAAGLFFYSRYCTTTVYFGPTKPADAKDGNWIQTDPKKGWFTLLRLYSPLEPFFSKQWRPGEIELMP